MSKKEKNKKKYVSAFFSLLMFVAGIALDIVYAAVPFLQTTEGAMWGNVCLYSGIGLICAGILAMIICITVSGRSDRRRRFDAEPIPEQISPSNATYIPAQDRPSLVTVGAYQSLEDKFAEIAKMDRTQFVIYVARLFSHKGYQVKLTPVIDNHDVDLIVEKLGAVTAVGCMIADRILTKEDVARVYEGKNYYSVNGCMALTNMYFDRSAVDFAKAQRISLVDRNILANEFMD